MKPINVDIIRRIEEVLSSEWQTAKEIKDKLNLDNEDDIPIKQFGKELKKLPSIEISIKHHYNVYRLKENGSTLKHAPKIITPGKQPEVSDRQSYPLDQHTLTEPAEIRNKLDTLMNTLNEEGIDTQLVCLNALQKCKEKHEKEINIVKKRAPMFYTSFHKTKDTVRELRNELQDYKDKVHKLEMRQVVRMVSEERRVKQEIM